MTKKILMAVLAGLCSIVCMGAKEKTTTGGVPVVKLNNGVEMPRFGLGTFMQSPQDCKQSCLTALKAGYRHIDTAHAYGNEAAVGEAVKESGVPREEIFIVSKLWPTEYGEGTTMKAIDAMLERMQLEYIDLLYLHQPVRDYVGAWKDMEKAVAAGKVKALGISNFDYNDEDYNTIMEAATIKPAALQIECHPYAQRLDIREKAKKDNIQIECWFPLGGAMSGNGLRTDPTITKIAEKYGKSPVQIIIRWHIQEGFSVIPGASNPDYIKEPIQVFDFELSKKDMATMRSLNKEDRFYKATREQTEQIVERLKPRDVTPEAKAIIELSRNKWTWMADKNVAELAKLFHQEAVFVHMGGFWGTKQELETIEKGFIHYKKADIERDEEVRFADNTAPLNSAIRLTAMVGGREVITPFFVTEVYIKQTDGSWKLSVLSFTSRPQMPARQ